jgi:hypothetical protein
MDSTSAAEWGPTRETYQAASIGYTSDSPVCEQADLACRPVTVFGLGRMFQRSEGGSSLPGPTQQNKSRRQQSDNHFAGRSGLYVKHPHRDTVSAISRMRVSERLTDADRFAKPSKGGSRRRSPTLNHVKRFG